MKVTTKTNPTPPVFPSFTLKIEVTTQDEFNLLSMLVNAPRPDVFNPLNSVARIKLIEIMGDVADALRARGIPPWA